MLKVAIVDDYAKVALTSADWSGLAGKAEITVFDRHLAEDEAARVLQPFDVICTMRERMAFPASLFERLPNLKLVTILGPSLANLDTVGATRCGIAVGRTSLTAVAGSTMAYATPELTWGLMIATVRDLARQNRRVREGGWLDSAGLTLCGRTLGLLGLGRIGKRMAEYAHAFGMNTIAWSQNLTEEAASEVRVRRVDKEELFRLSDVVSVHLQLSDRTRGLVTARELGLMKPGSFLINTSRGPIVVEADLIAALRSGHLAGAGLDTFDVEPLPLAHPFRTLENVTALPHTGYATHDTLEAFYGATARAVTAYANGEAVPLANPEVLTHARQQRA